MPKCLVVTVDAVGRTVTGACDDPYAFLAQRVQEGIISAKQAAQTQVFAVTEFIVNKTALQHAIDWERTIEQALRDPASVIERINKKTMSQEDLEALRTELRTRSLEKEDRFAAPWPWATEGSVQP